MYYEKLSVEKLVEWILVMVVVMMNWLILLSVTRTQNLLFIGTLAIVMVINVLAHIGFCMVFESKEDF